MKVFVTGKGGVGKSTVSVALSLAIETGRVKVVSLDPAHNIGDIFSYGNRTNVEIIEPDFDIELARYLKELTETMKREAFRYLTLFNLENLVDTLRYSPGTEEHMLLNTVEKYLFDDTHTIFDTPPTGLFLKVLGLLDSSILWTSRLIKLREDIVKRKGLKQDRILRLLQEESGKLTKLKEAILKKAVFVNVMNEDELSFKESTRVIDFLKRHGYRVLLNVVNRSKDKKVYYDGIEHFYIPSITGNPYEISLKISNLLKDKIREAFL